MKNNPGSGPAPLLVLLFLLIGGSHGLHGQNLGPLAQGASAADIDGSAPLFLLPQTQQGPQYLNTGAGSRSSPESGKSFLSVLRRFEIITLGTLPFTLWYSNIGYGLGRYLVRGLDAGFDSPELLEIEPRLLGGNVLDNDERVQVFLIAASASLLIGFIDMFIEGRQAEEAIP